MLAMNELTIGWLYHGEWHELYTPGIRFKNITTAWQWLHSIEAEMDEKGLTFCVIAVCAIENGRLFPMPELP